MPAWLIPAIVSGLSALGKAGGAAAEGRAKEDTLNVSRDRNNLERSQLELARYKMNEEMPRYRTGSVSIRDLLQGMQDFRLGPGGTSSGGLRPSLLNGPNALSPYAAELMARDALMKLMRNEQAPRIAGPIAPTKASIWEKIGGVAGLGAGVLGGLHTAGAFNKPAAPQGPYDFTPANPSIFGKIKFG